MQANSSSSAIYLRTMGDPYLSVFKSNLSAKFDGRSVLVSSKRPSVSLAGVLEILGVGNDDEVILPALCQSRHIVAIRRLGAIPVFTDIELSDYAIDSDRIEEKITSRTKVIIITHLFGQPALGIERILKIAQKNSLRLIEDISDAFGAKLLVNNEFRNVGSFGDIGYVDFSQVCKKYFKVGGIICKKDSVIHENLSKQQLLNSKFPLYLKELTMIEKIYTQIESTREQRKDVAAYYENRLCDTGDLILQKVHQNSWNTFTRYIIRTTRKAELSAFLGSEFQQSTVNYTLERLFSSGKEGSYVQGSFPSAERVVRESIFLPISARHPVKEAGLVVDAIRLFFSQH